MLMRLSTIHGPQNYQILEPYHGQFVSANIYENYFPYDINNSCPSRRVCDVRIALVESSVSFALSDILPSKFSVIYWCN